MPSEYAFLQLYTTLPILRFRNIARKDKNSSCAYEPAKQFYMRIGNYYYEIFEDGSINKLSAETGATLGLTIGNMNDIFKKLGINPKANTRKSLLEKFETTTNALPKGLVEVQSTIDDIF